MNNFALTNDNPGNTFPNNSLYHCEPVPSAERPLDRGSDQGHYATFPPHITHIPAPPPRRWLIATRRSISTTRCRSLNSSNEPIRQKWISDAYQTLKAILPPKAVDTPEELAESSASFSST